MKPNWHEVQFASEATHDECFRRYCSGSPELAAYRFEVSDFFSVRITDSITAANGIWTLAELRDGGATWREVSSVASKMRAAVKRHLR